MLEIIEQNKKKKRGRPRKLTIYQRSFIPEVEKPLTKKELFEAEWHVPYDFAQEHPEYMAKVYELVEKRKAKFAKKMEEAYAPKPEPVKRPRGRPRKTLLSDNTDINESIQHYET